ncbi:MAG: ATP-binding protein [Caldilineaceae bacterium]
MIMIQGEAGIGKTWFLDYLQDRIDKQQPSWRSINRYEAEAFVAPFDNLYYRFLRVLKDCDQKLVLDSLPALPTDPTTATIEQVAEWTSLLEMRLTEHHSQPLLLFFDEMEWWVGVSEEQQTTLTQLFRIVWAMLLRQAHLPIVIICAGRRIPPFKHPLLRLVLKNYTLNGFPPEALRLLIQPDKQATLLPLIQYYTENNPWSTQVLASFYELYAAAFDALTLPDPVLREIFEAVVGNQLDHELTLKETLYQLARQRQAGFTANDPLLPQGDATLIKLVNSSFVEFSTNAKRYFVIPVLTRWFKRSEHHDPQ